ncbi:MAG: (Fe-S)-binding protein [Myxococcota bacterium]|nr:(Fe-S)-binding protein [Myxococcota bacterium]
MKRPLPILSGDSHQEDQQIDICMTCPKLCRWACPVAESEGRETSTPWNLVNASGFVKRGWSKIEDYAELPFLCTHCGACSDVCLHSNDVPAILTLGRARVLDAGLASPKVVEVRDKFAINGNPYGRDLVPELMGHADSLLPSTTSRDDENKSLYFAGCSAIAEQPESVSAFARVVSKYGLQSVKVSELSAQCCGLPLLWAGDVDSFREHATRVAAKLSEEDSVIVHDSACAHAFVERYPEMGVTLDTKISTVTEFLHGELIEGREDTGSPKKFADFAISECCHTRNGLQRKGTEYALISSATGSIPRELNDLTGNMHDCCGAAGLLPITRPNTAREMASAKIVALRQSDASRLTSFSPRCIAHLRSVAPKEKVIDAMEILAAHTEDF